MSIKEKIAEIKENHKTRVETIMTACIIVLTGLLGFGIGKSTTIGHGRIPVRIEEIPIFQDLYNGGSNTASGVHSEALGAVSESSAGVVVGSRNSDKYHYPWCSGAKRISDANKVTFPSIEAARAAGYTPAGNCPGLK